MERRKAEERVEALVGWYIHFTVYIGVMCLLVAINIASWHGAPWALLAGIGWGLGLIAHAIRVGMFRSSRFERWRMAKINQLMRSPS